MKEDKKAKILEMGIDLFSKRGYLKTTVEDITNSLGISKGSFYTYFDSKETLLLGIIYYLHEEYAKQLQYVAIESEKLTVKEALELYIDTSIKTSLDNSSMVSLMQQMVLNDYFKVDAIKKMIPDFQGLDKNFIKENLFGRLKNKLSDGDLDIIIDYIIISIKMFIVFDLKQDRNNFVKENKEVIVKYLSSFILNGIYGILKEEL